MNKKNNNWKPGDIAICVKVGDLNPNIKGNSPNLRLNCEYLVQSVRTCECGHITLDVGLSDNPKNGGTICLCGARSSPKTGIHWCSEIRFVKKDTRTIEEQIEEAISNENFELANVLSKLENKKQ